MLGRYTIERELGRGGMGAVYLAQDRTRGERVALKTLTSSWAADPAERAARLRAEVQHEASVTEDRCAVSRMANAWA